MAGRTKSVQIDIAILGLNKYIIGIIFKIKNDYNKYRKNLEMLFKIKIGKIWLLLFKF